MTVRAQRECSVLRRFRAVLFSTAILGVLLSPVEVSGERLFCEPEGPRVAPRLAKQMAERKGELHLVWVLLTDKGVAEQAEYGKRVGQLAEKLAPRVRNRRAKCLAAGQITDFHDLSLYSPYMERVESLGVEIRHRSRWLNGMSLWATESQIEQLAELHFVRSIEEVRRSREVRQIPDGPELPSPLTLPSFPSIDYGSSLWQLEQISVPELHGQGYDGREVRICMLDSGFDNLGHQAFAQMEIVGSWDFLDGDEDISGDSHGTFTLSAIGGFSPGYLVGPAFGSQFLLARTEDVTSETPVEEDHWIAGLEWAEDQGADVVSSSLGYLDWDPGTGEDYTWEDLDGTHAKTTIAADIAVQKGIVIVNSAGNNGPDGTLNTPADGKGVISVGAVDPYGELADFSSRGPTYDGRIKPDVVAGGVDVVCASHQGSSDYLTKNGTSLSTPLVAGVCALLLQIHPDWTPKQVADALRQTASDLGSPGADNLYGWGLVNATAAAQFEPGIVPGPMPADRIYGWPNPFRVAGTKIYSRLATEAEAALQIYTGTGVLVRLLTGFVVEGDRQFVFWDGKDRQGNTLASGVYFCRFISGQYTAAGKITLIK